MAVFAKYLSFLFLLFIISSLQIHARESQFFSKVTRDNTNINTNNKNTATTEKELPQREETSHTHEEEPNFVPQNHNGFGLYGHGSEQFSPNSVNDAYYTPTNDFPEKTTTTTTEMYSPQNYQQNSFNYNHENRQQGMRDSRYVDASYLNNNNKKNNYYYNGNEAKKQGMSDTRFLENGKYFYDLNNEEVYHDRYHNQFETPKETHNGYASYRGVESRNRYNNYGGYNANNNANTYDFSNSLDGFQSQNEEFQQNQEYVP